MYQDSPLIATIVAGLVLACIFGMVAKRFRWPPLVGYLLAGILVGPLMSGFGADPAAGPQLAELGLILLMFGLGLRFSLKDLMKVRAPAIVGAVAQIGFATLLGTGLGLSLGWSPGGALLFGLALSMASAMVLLATLHDGPLAESEAGRLAMGWLIVGNFVLVLALVLLPSLAGLYGIDSGLHDPFVSLVERLVGAPIGIGGVLALLVVKLAAFAGFMLVMGRRIIPWLLHFTDRGGSRELFRLAVLALALGLALGSAALFGVSLALGAFFAGMILAEDEFSHRAAIGTLPLREAFPVLFFLSLGMVFDPMILVEQPLSVLATLFIIIIGKSVAAFALAMLFRRGVDTALTLAASLAQIGEFSFILAGMGAALTILPAEGRDLILAGALLSIMLNPLVFRLAEGLRPAMEARFGPSPIPAPVEPGMAASEPAPVEPQLPPGENVLVGAAAPSEPAKAVEAEPEPEIAAEIEVKPAEIEVVEAEIVEAAPADPPEDQEPAPAVPPAELTPIEVTPVAPEEDAGDVGEPAVAADAAPPAVPDESAEAASGDGADAPEAVEVVVPPVEPEPRGRRGKRKK
ncbi:cation:proton antiporter [Devosia sp. YIM 151766]|uniref:cation:proton antiporter domain-containing protein n=1 Tax=Devosia sp. YIM 151766 TaxID=3017325 RepID=UPI00255CF2D4|nr:cation:proton antiporter [Devosia sp. YIM 151766]WIY53144.1 cation:proton antiporter [Devosia sp. YIM 151766]